MPDEPIPDLLAQLQEDPADWSLRARICDAMLLAGRVGEAMSLLETAPAAPEDEPHVLKAAEVYSQGQPQKAVPILYNYLQANPSSALVHLAMVEAALQLGERDTAQSYYARAIELNPGYRDPEFEQKHGLQGSAAAVLRKSAAPLNPATLPAAGSPSAPSSAGTRHGAESRKASGIPGWVFTLIVALATFLVCWMLLGLGLRATLLHVLPAS